MKLLKNIVYIIDKINYWVFGISKWLIVALAIVIVFETISRYFFNSPHIWALEISSFLGGAFFMLALGYVTLKDKHITIDLLKNYISPKTKAIIDIITYVLFYCMFSLILFIYGTKFSLNSWITAEHSWSAWAPPLYLIKTVVPITGFLLLIQGIAVVIRKIIFLIEGEEI